VSNERESWFSGEPTVKELISDSAAHVLMRYDGVTIEDVYEAIRDAQSRLIPKLPETNKAA